MIDISVDLTNEMMWSMLTTGDCEYLDPIYNSYQQWYGADYPNIKQYSGTVVTGGFEPEPGHRTRLPLTEVMQESGEPPYNKEVTCGITIKSEYAPRVGNTQVVLQNSRKVPKRQSLTWKSRGITYTRPHALSPYQMSGTWCGRCYYQRDSPGIL